MKGSSKYYLFNIMRKLEPKYRNMFKEGHTIVFEMPPFCSGDYWAKIYMDEFGLYIHKDKAGYFRGCRDWTVEKNPKTQWTI